MKKRLFVTGASGFLGWHVCKNLPPDWEAIAAWNSNKIGIFHRTPALQVDLADQDATWKILKETKPDALFHLAANSSTAFCEQSPTESFAINVLATAHLAELCAERKIRLLFTSSEQVFDGEKGNYAEQDLPRPKNEYGKQKLEAETRLLAACPEAAIVRIAVLFGLGGPASKNFFGQWLENWKTGQPVTVFHDEIRQFLSGDSAANALFHLLRQDASGIFHLGGKEAVSRAAFAEMAAGVFGLPQAKIIRKSQQEGDWAAFRPKDLSLNCSKIKGTGFSTNILADKLLKLKMGFDG